MDHDELVNKRVAQIARDHGCTVDQVNAALDRHPIELDRDQFLRRTLALELIELDALQQAFRAKALEACDVGSGLLLLKVAERRATLLGMNAPQSSMSLQRQKRRPTRSLLRLLAYGASRCRSLMSPTIPRRRSRIRKFSAHRRSQAARHGCAG